MELRRVAAVLFATAMLLIGVPAAFADDPCTNNANGNGEGNGRPCEQVPEASHALAYSGAGAVVLIGFVAFETRRRRRRALALD